MGAGLALALGCEPGGGPVLIGPVLDVGLAPASDAGRPVDGGPVLDAGPPLEFERDLWIYHPYEREGPPNRGGRSARSCERPPETVVRPGVGARGDALVSTATTGCSNANSNVYLPSSGPYTLSVWLRADAPAPPGADRLEALSFRPVLELAVDERGDLVIRMPSRSPFAIRVLVPGAAGAGWHHVVVRVDPGAPSTEVFVDGALQGAWAEVSVPGPGPENGRTATWVGAIDELRTYARGLTALEIEALSRK